MPSLIKHTRRPIQCFNNAKDYTIYTIYKKDYITLSANTFQTQHLT